MFGVWSVVRAIPSSDGNSRTASGDSRRTTELGRVDQVFKKGCYFSTPLFFDPSVSLNIRFGISLHSNCNCTVGRYYQQNLFIPVIFGRKYQCKKKIGLSPTNPWEIKIGGEIYFRAQLVIWSVSHFPRVWSWWSHHRLSWHNFGASPRH
jgi:hypothetical protein